MQQLVSIIDGKKLYIFAALYAIGVLVEFIANGDFSIESLSMLLQQISASGGAAAFRAGIKKIGKE